MVLDLMTFRKMLRLENRNQMFKFTSGTSRWLLQKTKRRKERGGEDKSKERKKEERKGRERSQEEAGQWPILSLNIMKNPVLHSKMVWPAPSFPL